MVTKSRNKYHHGIAAYPTEWRGYLVSPGKICIQFNKLQCKTRIDQEYVQELYKKPGYWEMPIAHDGTDVEFVAVGVPIQMHPTMLTELLKAYEEYAVKYDRGVLDFLASYRNNIDDVLRRLNYDCDDN